MPAALNGCCYERAALPPCEGGRERNATGGFAFRKKNSNPPLAFRSRPPLQGVGKGRPMTERVPTGITLHQKSRVLEIVFSDSRSFRLPYEYLRVYSPSAEVRGHGPG